MSDGTSRVSDKVAVHVCDFCVKTLFYSMTFECQCVFLSSGPAGAVLVI